MQDPEVLTVKTVILFENYSNRINPEVNVAFQS